MSSVNKVILVGRLGADPELRYTTSGRAVCRLSLATNRRWRDAEGNPQEQTDWHKVTAWGKQGETCREHLKKGRQVYVEGRLRNSSYDDKETGHKRYSTEIVTHSVVFLGSGARPQEAPRYPSDAARFSGSGGYRSDGAGQIAERGAGQIAERGAGQIAERGAGQIAERGAGQIAERGAGQIAERAPGPPALGGDDLPF